MNCQLLTLLLNEQKTSYVLVDDQWIVHDQGGKTDLLCKEDESKGPLSLLDLVPELMGCEDILQEVLNEDLPHFQLENLNRYSPEGETYYVNVSILRYLPEEPFLQFPLLLVILSDTSEWTQIQQTLTQQRNELSLLKHELDQTNQRLEFILQRYVPREVGTALMENRILPKLGGEVREITALFADLRNYTSISEKLTPAETIEMLHVCLDIASTAIAEFGGVIVNYMGDAVMAIFNAPNEQLDHAYRAVQAGLTMQVMAKIYQKEENNRYPPIHFGVGINTGTALVGNVGAQWHYQYTAIGDTINVASRICSHAQPGEVLIGPNTHEHCSDKVQAHPLLPIKFKGKSQEMTVYCVDSILQKDNLF